MIKETPRVMNLQAGYCFSMESFFRYVSPPAPCGYLPDRNWSLEYEMVTTLTSLEYQQRLQGGWRRFGYVLFQPRCPGCAGCRSLRVLVERFQPSRSQRRAFAANAGEVVVRIGAPAVSRAKLRLYDRFHQFQAHHKGWPEHPAKDAGSYHDSFANNPFPTEEWCYYLNQQLVGVGYVDHLPSTMSAIYFFYDPAQRQRSLGTFNILCLLAEAAARGFPYLYLGYYVAACNSLEYKARFQPNQVLGADGLWVDFLNRTAPKE